MSKTTKIILAGVLVLALIFRTYKLTAVPPGLNQDEAVNGYDAYALGLTLRDHHGNFLPVMLQSFDDWASPLLTYLTIPFVRIFGLSLFTIRFVVVLLSVGSVWLFYQLLIKLFKSQSMALLGAFLLAVSPWHFTLSRWAIPPGSVTFFLLLFLVAFYWAMSRPKNSPWAFILPGLAGGLLVYSYPTLKLFAPLFIFTLAVIFLRRDLKRALILLLSFAVIVTPVFYLTFTDSKYNARFSGVSGLSGPHAVSGIVSRYLEYFSPRFQFGQGDLDLMHQVPGFGNSFGFLMPFFYLGLALTFIGIIKKDLIPGITPDTYWLLAVWVLLFPVAAALTRDPDMVLRVIHGLPLTVVFFILSSVFLNRYFPLKLTVVFLVLVFLLGAVNFGRYLNFYLSKYPDLAFRQYQSGLSDIFDYLHRNSGSYDKVIIDQNINKPYIYDLFYSALPPQNLNYRDPTASNPKYIYGLVTTYAFELPNLYTAGYRGTPVYGIFAKDSNWYVKLY